MIGEQKLKEYRNELLNKLENQKEVYIRQALSELLDRGLLVFEDTLPRFDLVDGKEVKITGSFRLVLKNMEYVRKLEKQNKIMKEALEKIDYIYEGNRGTDMWELAVDALDAVKQVEEIE